MNTHAGKRLGRYRLESSVGQGGMAEVYRAFDDRLERQVAVKVILPAFAAEVEFRERFLREARLVAGLEHTHILPIYDFGEEDGIPYLVMPFLDGGTLEALLAKQPLSRVQVAEYVRQLAAALDHAHGAGILHRDVKPANVLFGSDGRLILADFGIAKLLEQNTRLTATGMMVGTPAYMAPELARGEPASAAADRYALGCLAFEMLSGEPPFTGENALSLLHQHVNQPVPSLAAVAPSLPPELDAVFAHALAKDPAARPVTCTALAEALAGEGRTLPLPAPCAAGTEDVRATLATPGAAGRPGGVGGRSRRVGMASLVALCLLLLLGAGWMIARLAAGKGPKVVSVAADREAEAASPAAAGRGGAAAAEAPGDEAAEAGAVPRQERGPSGTLDRPAPPAGVAGPEEAASSSRGEQDVASPSGSRLVADLPTGPTADPTREATAEQAPDAAPAPPPGAAPAREPTPGSAGPAPGSAGPAPRSAGPAPGPPRARATPGQGARGRARGGFDPRQLSPELERLLRRLERLWLRGRPRPEVFDDLHAEVERLVAANPSSPILPALRTFLEAGVAYVGGKEEQARSRLTELARSRNPVAETIAVLPARALRAGGELEDWHLAIAFGDPLGTGWELIAAAEAAAGESAPLVLGRALLAHLDGDHAGAARLATEAQSTATAEAWRRELELLIGTESLHADRLDQAIEHYQQIGKEPLLLRRAIRAIEVWGGQGLLREACRGGLAPACLQARRSQR